MTAAVRHDRPIRISTVVAQTGRYARMSPMNGRYGSALDRHTPRPTPPCSCSTTGRNGCGVGRGVARHPYGFHAGAPTRSAASSRRRIFSGVRSDALPSRYIATTARKGAVYIQVDIHRAFRRSLTACRAGCRDRPRARRYRANGARLDLLFARQHRGCLSVSGQTPPYTVAPTRATGEQRHTTRLTWSQWWLPEAIGPVSTGETSTS